MFYLNQLVNSISKIECETEKLKSQSVTNSDSKEMQS